MKEYVYFAGRTIKADTNWVVTDRLGSVAARSGSRQKYFPYGEDPTDGGGATRFATYFHDNNYYDYADQRYYARVAGRFLTADRYKASGGAADPGSWNRYSYVQGDPVNFNDPQIRCLV